MKVAFQGERGAYSEEATRQAFPDAEVLPCARFSDAFEAVVERRADRAVIPVENSQAGTIAESYDLLLAHPLFVVGEIDLRVRHCLLALPGETLETLREAHSHPQALAQTDEFLRRHALKPVVEYDTAGSAKKIAEQQVRGAAAVASRVAAEIYGLMIVAEGIETNRDNRTRFVILDTSAAPRSSAPSKTSLVFSLRNTPGALYRALEGFSTHFINVTKIESRPSRSAAWEYVFYLDLDGHQDEPPVAEALAQLEDHCEFLRVLGSYRKALRSP